MIEAELAFLKLLENVRTDFLSRFFELVTIPGEDTVIVALIVGIFFLYDKHLAKKLFFITAASFSVNGVIKNVVRRPRPFALGAVTCLRPETATGYAFPSGHTQNFVTWSSALALHFKRHWITVLVCVMTLLVGFSRLYLGAHYPTDVLAGILLGLSLSFLCGRLYDSGCSEHLLHGAAAALLAPFAVLFLVRPDPLFADFFKSYGLMLGLFVSALFEEKFVQLECSGPFLRRFIRFLIGIAAALFIKEGAKLIFVFSDLRLSLISQTLRYFLLVFAVAGVCPLIFKKVRL